MRRTVPSFLILVLLLVAFLSTLPIHAVLPVTTTGPAKGNLVIVGGGAKSPAIFQRLIKLAGGPSSLILVVPTAEADDKADLDHAGGSNLRKAGATNLQLLHTRDRKIADSDEFVKPILQARGIWLSGGRQWRLADVYLGTKTQRAFAALLDRGGVIGGSSAGATIQGSLLVRGDPSGNTIMLSPGHLQGFGFLQNSAVDQHVIVRKRQNDLIPVIQQHPALLGIGLDEDTAIIVHGNQFEVMGASKALIYDATAPHSAGAPWWLELSNGDRFDMATRRKVGGAR
jgi:cyanophycinase